MDLIIENLNNKNLKLENRIVELENRIVELESKRNEIYYQKFLERVLSASHQKTIFGITDVTTEKEHIEIKHWKNYKNALGQLLSYNHNDNKHLVAYFFGAIDKTKQEKIIELYNSNKVSIKQFIDTSDGVIIENVLDCTIQNKNEDQFYDWLDKNIEYKENEILKITNICENYIGKKVGPRIMTRYKKQIEDYIKEKYKHINNIFQHTTFNGVNYKGWKHIRIKET